VAGTLAPFIGSRDVFAGSIRQRGSDLTATVAFQGNRTSCELAGTVSGTTVGLQLTSCRAGRISGVRCSNGAMRDLELLAGRITADADNGTGTGTDVSTWNVFAVGTTEPVGTLTLAADFRWNLTRLPHDDFHVFDGSILAGYVDGVVTIPEDQTPFCTTCGWFSSGDLTP
jgi:hypothetical protein